MRMLRVRIELNKGRKGIPMHKMAALTEEIQKFFQRVGIDLGLAMPKEQWLAVKFANGSLDYDAEYQGRIAEEALQGFYSELIKLPKLTRDHAVTRLSPSTILQYIRIAEPMDEDERVRFGLYNNGARKPTEWQTFTKAEARQIAEFVASATKYRGVVQGIVHSWFKEATPPYLNLRESVTGRIVKVFYEREDYPQIVSLLQKKNAVVQVVGMITANMIDRHVDEVHAHKFAIAEELSNEAFERFFGSAPDLTGDLTTEEYVSSVRDYAE
jgi:hypothetical protein